MQQTPSHWRYPLFPCHVEQDEALSLDHVAALGHQRLDEAAATFDEAPIGPVLHWAHVLKSEQGPDGSWPALVDPRTGVPAGSRRTRAPAALLARLAGLIQTTEFDDCIRRGGEDTLLPAPDVP